MLRCKGQTLAFCLFSSLFSLLYVTIQRDFGSLGRGGLGEPGGVTKAKCKVLHLGNPKGEQGLGDGSKPALREGIGDFGGLKAQQ